MKKARKIPMKGITKTICIFVMTFAVVFSSSVTFSAQKSLNYNTINSPDIENKTNNNDVQEEKSKSTKQLYEELKYTSANNSPFFKDYPLNKEGAYQFYTNIRGDDFRDMLIAVKKQINKTDNKKSKKKTSTDSKKKTSSNTTYSVSDNTLYINGSGEMDDYTSQNEWGELKIETPWYSLRDEIKKIVISDGITRIGKGAFYNFDKVEEVSIPSTVTVIDDYAFSYCSSLENVEFPNGLTKIGDGSFRDASLKTINLPEGLVSIGSYESLDGIYTVLNLPDSIEHIGRDAFSSKLTEVYIGKSLKNIDGNPFTSCYDLRDIKVSSECDFYIKNNALFDSENKLVTYFKGLIEDTYYIPDGTVTIGEEAFSGSISSWTSYRDEHIIKNIVIPDSVKIIESYAFYCTDLSSVQFGKGVEEINKASFKFNRIKTLSLPNSLTMINTWAFARCGDELESVTLPKNVISIGNGVFEANYSLNDIYVSEENDNFKSVDGVLLSKDGKKLYQYLDGRKSKKYTMPDTVERIEWEAFYNNQHLENITLSNNLKFIDYLNFSGFGELKEITFPDSLVETKYTNFCFNDKLEKATVGKNLSKIEGNFMDNIRMKDVYFLGDLPEDYYTMLPMCKSTVHYPQYNYTWEGGNITCKNTNLSFKAWDNNLHYKTDISSAEVVLSKNTYTYDGTAKCPAVKVILNSKEMMNGVDYEYKYLNNINAGTAWLEIKGINDCYGTIKKEYIINKASQTLSASLNVYSVKIGETAKISASGYGSINYTSENDSIAVVNASGEVTGIKAGTVNIKVSASGNNNYESVEKKLAVNVTGNIKKITREDLKYSFINTWSSFGYKEDYRIPRERYLMFFSPQQADFYYKSKGTWGGSCAGFAGTTMLFNNSDSSLNINDFNSNVNLVSGLRVSDYSSKYGIDIQQLIESFQVGQSNSIVSSPRSENWDDYSGLADEVKKCENGGMPPYISVYSIEYGHALVGFKFENVNSSEDRIYVYDCNKPNEDKFLTLYKSGGKYTGFYYNNGYEYSKNISYVPNTAYKKLWDNRNITSTNYNNSILVNCDNFTLSDDNNKVLAKMVNGEFESYDDEIYENIECDSTRKGHEIIAPVNHYRIKNEEKASDEDLKISVVDTNSSASITTQSNDVEFKVDDTQNTNLVTVDGKEGEDYKITLNSETDLTKDNPKVEYKGESNGKETTIGTSYGEYINDNYTRNGIRVEDTAVLVDNYGGLDISDYEVKLNKTEYVYSGSAVLPDITVKNEYGNALSENIDYVIVADSNIKPGKVNAQVFGINEYRGKIDITYEIKKGNLTDCDIVYEKREFTYTGKEIKPQVYVMASGTKLIENVDYKVTYSNNIEPGYGWITVQGIGDWDKNVYKSTTFKIVEPATLPPTTDKPSEPSVTTPIVTDPITTDPVVTEPVTAPNVTDPTQPDSAKPATPKIAAKKANTIKVTAKTKTVKAKKLKKKAQKVKAITVKGAQGKVTYKLVKSGITKKIRKLVKINSKGVITIKKWKKAKKGTYKIKVTVKAAGNANYNAKTVTKTVNVKVK